MGIFNNLKKTFKNLVLHSTHCATAFVDYSSIINALVLIIVTIRVIILKPSKQVFVITFSLLVLVLILV